MKVNTRLAGRLLPALLAVFLAVGCRSVSNPVKPGQAEAAETVIAEPDPAEAAEADSAGDTAGDSAGTNPVEADSAENETLEAEAAEASDLSVPGLPEAFALSMVPEYSGSIWADVNEDVPFFDDRQMEAARRMTSAMSLFAKKTSSAFSPSPASSTW